MNIIKEYKYLILLLILSLPALRMLLTTGFYEPHDLHHLADIYQMYRALGMGQIPPRWAPDFLFNFGYPLFNFYYVLPFYLGAFFKFAGFALTSSYKLVFILTVFLSVIGMYGFLREFFGKYAALAGSLLFLYTPYRAVQIYVRGAMGEAFALSLLPFVLWMLVKLIKKPSFKSVAICSLIFSLLVISHNYLWILSLPFLAIFVAIVTRFKKQFVPSLKALILSFMLSLGLSSYFLIPAIFERQYIKRLTPFLLEDHFPFIKQLIIPSWGYGSSVWGPGDEISFQIGLVNLAVVSLIIIVFFVNRKVFDSKKLVIFYWSVGGFLVSVFMMNIRSLFLWKLIPFYNFVQFPWRLLVFTTFFTSLTASLLIETVKKKRILASFMIIASCIFLTSSYFQPSSISYKSDDEYLKRFFADRGVNGTRQSLSDEYIFWSEDYLLLPDWAEKKPDLLPVEKIEVSEGSLDSYYESSPIDFKATVNLDKRSEVTVNVLYFPGWVVYANNEISQIYPKYPYGNIAFELDEGVHDLKVEFTETPLRQISNLISIFSASVLLFIIYLQVRQNLAKKTIGRKPSINDKI